MTFKRATKFVLQDRLLPSKSSKGLFVFGVKTSVFVLIFAVSRLGEHFRIRLQSFAATLARAERIIIQDT